MLVNGAGRAGGAYYAALRVSDASTPEVPSVTRACVRCGTDVWVDEDAVALADSCVGIACSVCTGSSDGILFIAPPGW